MRNPISLFLLGSAAFASRPQKMFSFGFVNTVPLKTLKNKSISNLDSYAGRTELSLEKSLETGAKKDDNRPVIAILDAFSPNDMKLGKRATSHGKIVETILKNKLPNAKISKYNINDTEELPIVIGPNGLPQLRISLSKINKAFGRILKRIEKGEKIDAINLSVEYSIPLEPILPRIQTKKSSKELIKDLIDESDDKQFKKEERLVLKTIDKMEKIVKKGTKIFVAAGNHYDHINQFSFAEGVQTIGASDARGKSLDFYSHTKFVDREAQGLFNITPILGKNNKFLGWDITGSGRPEIKKPTPLQESTVYVRNDLKNILAPPDSGIGPVYSPDGSGRPASTALQGTSFSCPVALVEDLLKNRNFEN